MTKTDTLFRVSSTMLGISSQKSEASPIKPDRMRVTSQSLDSALTVFKGHKGCTPSPCADAAVQDCTPG
jgi:hypothetical protein